MKYTIQEAANSDLDEIISLKIRMFEDANLLHLLKNDCTEEIKKTYTHLYDLNLAKHFIIKVDSKVVAMAGSFIKDDIPYYFYKYNKYGFIGDMYTVPEFRRRGFAQELLTQSIGWLKLQKVSNIQLLASKQGKQLYINNGFKDRPECMILEV